MLHSLTVRVPAGKTVAFVGESGSGKSTIIQMLCRFYDPLGGQVGSWAGAAWKEHACRLSWLACCALPASICVPGLGCFVASQQRPSDGGPDPVLSAEVASASVSTVRGGGCSGSMPCHAMQVLLDGVDIRQLQLRWYRQQLALVSQEPTLFATTIAGNISYGCPGASEADIEAAAHAANAMVFIEKLPLRCMPLHRIWLVSQFCLAQKWDAAASLIQCASGVLPGEVTICCLPRQCQSSVGHACYQHQAFHC